MDDSTNPPPPEKEPKLTLNRIRYAYLVERSESGSKTFDAFNNAES